MDSINNQFDILETMTLEGKIIVAGIVAKGMFYKGEQCKIGPDAKGNFLYVDIGGIHCKKVEVKSVTQGQFCSVSLDLGSTKDIVRRGMVLLGSKSNPIVSTMFEAEIWNIEGNEKTTSYKWQPIVHIGHIRQSVRLRKLEDLLNEKSETTNPDEEIAIYNDKTTKLIFEFMYSPEYIKQGEHLIIYDNSLKIYGYVTKLIK